MAIQCPHFMIPTNSLAQHLEASLPIPAFHKTIKMNLHASEKEILSMIQGGKCLKNYGTGELDPTTIIKPAIKQRIIDRK